MCVCVRALCSKRAPLQDEPTVILDRLSNGSCASTNFASEPHVSSFAITENSKILLEKKENQQPDKPDNSWRGGGGTPRWFMARMASVGETIEREVGRILERDPASTPSVLPEAQAAAKYVASFVQSSIFPAGSPKEVKDLVDAIRGLRRRRLFCEATFRSELRKNSLSCGILLSWELSRCGVLTWWDHLRRSGRNQRAFWASKGRRGRGARAARQGFRGPGGRRGPPPGPPQPGGAERGEGPVERAGPRPPGLPAAERPRRARSAFPSRSTARSGRTSSATCCCRARAPRPRSGCWTPSAGGPPQRCPRVPLRAEGRDCWGSWPRRGRDGGPRGRRGDGDPGGIVAG